jgi:hypothetical protein
MLFVRTAFPLIITCDFSFLLFFTDKYINFILTGYFYPRDGLKMDYQRMHILNHTGKLAGNIPVPGMRRHAR